MENLTAANTVEPTEGIANPQATETTTQATTGATAQPTAQEQTQTQQPDITQTQAFARRLKEETQKAKDQLIAEIYGQYGITTYDQYQQELEKQRAEQEAQQYGVDPQFYQEFSSLKSELLTLRQEREMNELRNDPIHGNFFKQWEGEVAELASRAHVSPRVAYAALLERKLPDILNSTKTAGQQEAITKITQNAQTSPGALGSEAAQQGNSIKNMSDKDFDALVEAVKRGERKSL
jgi:hypothetical protein